MKKTEDDVECFEGSNKFTFLTRFRNFGLFLSSHVPSFFHSLSNILSSLPPRPLPCFETRALCVGSLSPRQACGVRNFASQRRKLGS